MTFYEIKILSIPTISFACDVEVSNYQNRFLNKKDFLEISLGHSGLLLWHDNGTKEVAPANTVTVITSEMCCRTASYGEQLQRHTTVGVKMKYRLLKHTSEDVDASLLRQKVQQGDTILLPHLQPLKEDFKKAVRLLRAIITARGAGDESASVHALSAWFSLTGFLTDYVLQALCKESDALPPSEYAFAAKASEYIAAHITKKLSVSQIATHCGISEGYLHRIFKNIKGCGITAYINKRRVAMVEEMIQNKNISLKEAAASVGIEDTVYMSRLFKKVTGTSFREYYKGIR